jgi:hypothetical protein
LANTENPQLGSNYSAFLSMYRTLTLEIDYYKIIVFQIALTPTASESYQTDYFSMGSPKILVLEEGKVQAIDIRNRLQS